MAKAQSGKKTSESVRQKTKILWQIGKSGGGMGEFLQKGEFQEEFNYNVDRDPDSINRPQAPGTLVSPECEKLPNVFSTRKLNIHFFLPRNYAEGELTLFYNRSGIEEDSIFLDDQLLTKIAGTGEKSLKKSEISLGAASSGQHILSITTSGGDGKHTIDYLKLEGVITPAEEKIQQHLSATGLEDYGFWWKQMAKTNQSGEGAPPKPFRRGRIWA